MMDWQLTCRVCLESGDMVSLFDSDENNEQLADKYSYCCGVEVPRNDTLPTLICLNCVDRLTFSYQFKQQCLSSNETLKECLEEFTRSSAAATEGSTSKQSVKESETITIKQENGVLLQYELPIENEATWMRTLSKSADKAVVTKAPRDAGSRKRGRPRKYPNEQGQIDVSPYQRKKPKPAPKEEQSLTSLINTEIKEETGDLGNDDQAEENADAFSDFGGGDDPDFMPDGEEAPVSDNELLPDLPPAKKRGRPRKRKTSEEGKEKSTDEQGDDVLLQETILAFSEPIPEHILNPKKPVKKYKYEKKKYKYEKTHTCETCGNSFTSNASLQAHIRRHLGIKPFVCSICGYSCVLNMELRRHMTRHTGDRPYKCRICDRRFGDFGSRQKHESLCGYAFAAKECLTRHMTKHTGAKPYKCRTCDKAYTDYSTRAKHERSLCGYMFAAKEQLTRHMIKHTGAKPYKCRMCEKTYTDWGTRAKHERLHMGLRPYKCSVCGKAFTYSYVLANHMLTHTGEKKYSCTPCNKKFTKAHHLKYHNKVHHKELYLQQQLEAEAKKMRRQINISGLSGVISGRIVDGRLQIVQGNDEGEGEGVMQVVEVEEGEEGEADRAVAEMQAVELGSEYDVKDDSLQSD